MNKRHSRGAVAAAALFGALSIAGPAGAVPGLRAQVTQQGDFVLLGNTLAQDCSAIATNAGNPVVGTVGACGAHFDKIGPDVLWDADDPAAGQATASTAIVPGGGRSTAVLNLPAGATVTQAFLYWGARPANFGMVAGTTAVLDRPGGGGFSSAVTALTSLVVPGDPIDGADFMYQSVADVTAIVQQNGAGAYRVSGVASVDLRLLNSPDLGMGWWMVVVYQDLTAPVRQMTLFDGLDFVNAAASPVALPLAGFLVPAAPPFTARLGIVAYDGDTGVTGDGLAWGGTALFDAQNPVNDFFNGTRSFLGAPVSNAGDLPQLAGTAGSMSEVDVDVIDVTNAVAAGQNAVTVNATTTTDSYFVGGLITSITAGCANDAQCNAAQWCNEGLRLCTAQLANGVAIPSDPGHSPVLNGMCSMAAGALVCLSQVCDPNDNLCGFANGDGPCLLGNGDVVCRSGVCSASGVCMPAGSCDVDADCAMGNWCNESVHTCTPVLANGVAIPNDPGHSPVLNGMCSMAAGALVCLSQVCDPNDSLCGFANGDGPCDALSGPVVCRSGLCSAAGLCIAAGACDVDADCALGNWCNESVHTCTPKLANGIAVPSDPGHSPVLNGMCSMAAGALVCVSAVCDPNDSLCGFANGDGPCDALSGPVVCRSGVCSDAGLCIAAGACDVDADCAAASWCDESIHTCTPKLANGVAVPNDPGHIPVLNGMCSMAAGALVCVSTVCDPNDNLCGFADGDGPCMPGNGPLVCRSGVCSASGVCVAAGACDVDADCAAGNWCKESVHTCTPVLANGVAVPIDAGHNPVLNGVCSMAAGALVCASQVCDPNDNLCGFANGDGPCDALSGPVVCRSGICSAGGVCAPEGACEVDADCSGGDWCAEATHTCTAKLANGSPVPNDPPHENPQLNGMCTMAAATLVCQSGVCDPADGKCGFANGDGPCDAGDGASVCRSTICAVSGANQGLCVACVMDAQCPANAPACTAANACAQCATDADCGDAMSGEVCAAATSTCVLGCRGTGGNGCPTPEVCTSSDATVGMCVQCATDADCGDPTSGKVCDASTGSCAPGCRGMSGNGCPSGQVCTSQDTTAGDCVQCTKDADCGGPTSGQICDVAAMTCGPGCRGAGGNGCPAGQQCSSSDDAAGTCNSGTGGSGGSSGTGGAQTGGITASGNGLVCAARPGEGGGDAGAWLLGALAGVLVASRRRRTRA